MSDAGLGSETPLPEDIWQLVFSKALSFASKYIKRLRWRGALGGILPSGADAESIATHAAVELLQTDGAALKLFATRNGSSRAVSGATRLPRSISSALSRRVWRQVDRLHHRKENFLVRNEADLPCAFADDGEPGSLVESVPDLSDNPLQALLQKETSQEIQSVQSEFGRFLGHDHLLRSLLACQMNGIRQPRLLARQLKLSVPATKNLQKRLKRRLRQFLEQSCRAV
jgi:hypothetical protein